MISTSTAIGVISVGTNFAAYVTSWPVNWLLVGIAQFDLVAAITGDTFGETNPISSIVYILVGVSGIALLPTLASWLTHDSQAVAI